MRRQSTHFHFFSLQLKLFHSYLKEIVPDPDLIPLASMTEKL